MMFILRYIAYIQIFFPTLVEAAGLQTLDPCPELSNSSMLCTEGSSLMPLLEEPSISEWKKAVFWQYPRYLVAQLDEILHNNVQYPRGDFIGHHLQKIMGYSMRTKEWHYTEWVGINHLGKTDYRPSFLP